MPVALRVGLLAGEASGDTLGADLILALRQCAPEAKFFGVAGAEMQAAGGEGWGAAGGVWGGAGGSLAVLGFLGGLRDLPRLIKLLARIKRMFLTERPDVFI